MGADTARADNLKWQASAINRGACNHVVQQCRPRRDRTQLFHMARRRPATWHREVAAAPHRGRRQHSLLTLLAELRQQASTRLGHAAGVACCFEAGRDGFWLHRLLTAHGIAAHVLEPTSIRTSAIHADRNPVIQQQTSECGTGKLTALIGVENLIPI